MLLPGELILAGVKLIFFKVADLGLYFGFVVKRELIIQRCFFTAGQVLHSLKAFSASCTTPAVRMLDVHEELERDTAKTADPN